jgi:hypothetical protein
MGYGAARAAGIIPGGNVVAAARFLFCLFFFLDRL